MSVNKIGIHNSPYEFTKLYKGQYNGIRFIILYNKLYENEYGETEYTTEVNWIDFIDEDRKKTVNEAVIKIFKNKLDQKLIIQD
jgi:hypothetical protein